MKGEIVQMKIKRLDSFCIYNPYSNNEVTFHYINIIEKALSNLGLTFSRVNELHKVTEESGIIVISPLDVMKARRAGFKYIICWCQGIIPEESFLRHHSYLRKAILSIEEKSGLKNADYLFFVSEEMKDFYEKKYKLSFKNYFIMPCFNEEFPATKFKSDFKKRLSFVYAGGIDSWQCFDETILYFSKIQELYPEAIIYVLVKDKNYAQNVLTQYNIKNYLIDYLPVNELAKLLETVEFGFCLRKESSVNNVSTPTKLSTYICNGIRPIFTKSIKSFSNIAKKSNYVIEIDDVFDLKKLKRLEKIDLNILFDDYKSAFGSYFNSEFYIKKIQEIFSRELMYE